MAREIAVRLVGDSRDLERAFDRAAKSGRSFGASAAKAGKIAGLGLAGGMLAAAVAGKKFISAAQESEKAQRRMTSTLKALGVNYGKHAKQIDEVIQKQSRLAALDDEELQDSFTRLARVTGSVNQGLKGMALAADVARGRGIELAAATAIVEKANLGQLGALKRIGIEIPRVTAAQDALKASNDKATAAQIAAAKAADEAATRQSAVAALQKQFGTAAEDYGNSSAAAGERFKVAIENLQESLGTALLPTFAKVTNAATGWITKAQESERLKEGLRTAMQIIKVAIEGVAAAIAALARFAQEYWPKVRAAAEAVAVWYRTNLEPTIRSVARNIAGAWEAALADMEKDTGSHTRATGGIIATWLRSVVSGLNAGLAGIRGDWQAMWENVKSMAAASLRTVVELIVAWRQTLKGAIAAAAPAVRDAAWKLGIAIGQGVASGIRQTPGLVKDALEDVVMGGFDWIRGKIVAKSPSMLFHLQVGKPIAEGIAAGIKSGKVVVTDAMRDLADAALSAAQSRMQGAFGRFSALAGQAFGAVQGGQETPAEKLLRQMDEEQARQALARQRAEAEAAMASAATEEEKAEAMRALREVELAEVRAFLETQAAEERKQLDARLFVQQQNFQAQMAALQSHLESGKLTTKQAAAAMTALLKRFGINAGSAAAAAGAAIAKGLRDSVPAVAAAAAQIAAAMRNAGIIASAPEPAAPGGGGGGSSSGGGGMAGLTALAAGMGLGMSSGLRPGDPGDHGKGKAGDFVGTRAEMAAFANAAMRFAGIKDVIYGELPYWMDNGRMVQGWAGNEALRAQHAGGNAHVHASIFDKGGILPPGLTMAYNGTGRNEYVSKQRPGGGLTVIVNGVVGDAQAVALAIRDELVRYGRSNGSIFAGYA